MCDNCGKDHPEFDEISPEVQFLDRAADRLLELEESRPDNGYSMSINPFAVDHFARMYSQNTADDFMRMKVNREGLQILESVEAYGAATIALGFSIAMMTFRYWLEKYPGLYETTSFPTEEEAAEWLANQHHMHDAVENSVAPTQENIKEALRAAGIVVPDDLVVMGLNRLLRPIEDDDGGDQKQTGNDTGMYL